MKHIKTLPDNPLMEIMKQQAIKKVPRFKLVCPICKIKIKDELNLNMHMNKKHNYH
jgi:hypothetical protein